MNKFFYDRWYDSNPGHYLEVSVGTYVYIGLEGKDPDSWIYEATYLNLKNQWRELEGESSSLRECQEIIENTLMNNGYRKISSKCMVME
jgi:hypothetical protein